VLWSSRYEAPSGYEFDGSSDSEVAGFYRLKEAAIVPTTARITADEEA
jgi:hypothetical protein